MASGTISLSSAKAWEGQIEWTATADVATNASVLYVKATMWKTDGYTTSSNSKTSGTITIDGASYNLTGYQEFKTAVTIYENTFTIYHNTDGTKSLSISLSCKGQASTSLASATLSGSETITLDDIPQSVSLTAADNFTDEGNPAITYSNPAGSNATTLKIYILSSDEATTYASRDLGKTDTTATISLTDTERDAMRNAIPEATKMTVVFKLEAYFGTVQKESKLSRTFSIVNADPEVTQALVVLNGADYQELTGSAGKLIRYVSNVRVTVTASALKGASIASYLTTCGSAKLTEATGTISQVESKQFVTVVTDSRGNKTTKTFNGVIVEYSKPTVSIVQNAPDTSGNFTFTVKGTFFNGNFGAADNTLAVSFRYKAGSGEFSDWTEMTPAIDGNDYTAEQVFEGLDYQTTYTYQVIATDQIGSAPTVEKAIRTMPIFAWDESSFTFNVPVTFNQGLTGARSYKAGDSISFKNYQIFWCGAFREYSATSLYIDISIPLNMPVEATGISIATGTQITVFVNGKQVAYTLPDSPSAVYLTATGLYLRYYWSSDANSVGTGCWPASITPYSTLTITFT